MRWLFEFPGPDGWKTTALQDVSPNDVLFHWSPKHQDLEVTSKNSLPVYLNAPGKNRTHPPRVKLSLLLWPDFLFFRFLSGKPAAKLWSEPFLLTACWPQRLATILWWRDPGRCRPASCHLTGCSAVCCLLQEEDGLQLQVRTFQTAAERWG